MMRCAEHATMALHITTHSQTKIEMQGMCNLHGDAHVFKFVCLSSKLLLQVAIATEQDWDGQVGLACEGHDVRVDLEWPLHGSQMPLDPDAIPGTTQPSMTIGPGCGMSCLCSGMLYMNTLNPSRWIHTCQGRVFLAVFTVELDKSKDTLENTRRNKAIWIEEIHSLPNHPEALTWHPCD